MMRWFTDAEMIERLNGEPRASRSAYTPPEVEPEPDEASEL